MKSVRIVDVTPPRRAPFWAPIAAPVVAVFALAGAALTAAAFLTVFVLLAGVVLAALLAWRVSGWFPRRRDGRTPPRASGRDRAAFDAYLNARAEAARRARETDLAP